MLNVHVKKHCWLIKTHLGRQNVTFGLSKGRGGEGRGGEGRTKDGG